jgi:hypothetical protein
MKQLYQKVFFGRHHVRLLAGSEGARGIFIRLADM